MFNSTVFILGAGASCGYGYPTGEGLVRDIREEAEKLLTEIISLKHDLARKRHFISNAAFLLPDYVHFKVDGENKKIGQALNEVEDECKRLISRLDLVHPPVIDYFLHKNPDICNLGTFLISLVILKAEEKSKKEPANGKRSEEGFNWYRYVIHNLMIDCNQPEDLLKNDVYFITFNYDVSLETHLFNALKETEFFSGSDVVEKFLEGNRIFHVYGKIDPIKDDQDLRARSEGWPFFKNRWQYDQALVASGGIKTIAPTKMQEDLERFEFPKKIIDAASTIYILGYGFDKTNSDNLNLFKSLNLNNIINRRRADPAFEKRIFFTNYLDRNLVNKRASEIFFGNQTEMLSHKPSLCNYLDNGAYFEKSILKVYGAFESDFDF